MINVIKSKRYSCFDPRRPTPMAIFVSVSLHAVTYDILKIKNKYAVAVLNLQYIN